MLMGYVKFQKGHYTNFILNLFLIIAKTTFLALFLTGVTHSQGLSIERFFPKNKCFSIFFLERLYFDGEYETYRGVLIKEGNRRWKIIYETSPPFRVEVIGDTVKMGYEGEEFQTFDAKEYKNPVLEILIHLEEPEKLFKFQPAGKDSFTLVPKGEISDYISRGRLILKDGKPYIVEVESGEDNRITIVIEKITPECR
jgi:hypothetical protein